jgi:hypothetical protein
MRMLRAGASTPHVFALAILLPLISGQASNLGRRTLLQIGSGDPNSGLSLPGSTSSMGGEGAGAPVAAIGPSPDGCCFVAGEFAPFQLCARVCSSDLCLRCKDHAPFCRLSCDTLDNVVSCCVRFSFELPFTRGCWLNVAWGVFPTAQDCCAPNTGG